MRGGGRVSEATAEAPYATGNGGGQQAFKKFLCHADPRMTAKYAHVVDMAKKNPALFIPVKVG